MTLPTVAQRPVPPLRGLAGFLIAVLALAVVGYWPQLSHPALYRDDWQLAWAHLYHAHDFVSYAITSTLKNNRPVYMLINHLLTGVFGPDARALLIAGLIIDALVCTAAFALLRVLGLGSWSAAALAGLLMVFPLADSTRLLPAIAPATLGGGFFLLGATLAIRALARPRRQAGWMHVGTVVAYLASLLTYESAAALIALSFLIYRVVVPWRQAIRHWVVEIRVIVLLFGVYLIVNRVTGYHANTAVSLGELPHRLGVFAYQSGGVIALSLFPAGPAAVTRLVVLERVGALLAVLVILAAALAWLARRRRGLPAEVWRGGWAIVAALIALALAYVPYIVAAGDYQPLERGEGNRVNNLAAIPLLLIAYGLLRLAVTLPWGRLGARLRRASLACVAVALALVSLITVRGDIRRWQYTAARQRELQAVVRRALARRPGQYGVVVAGPLDLFSPAIPHPDYREVLNLMGTFSVPLGRILGREYLVAPGARFTCQRHAMFPAGSPQYLTAYGSTLFLRFPGDRPVFVRDRPDCLRLSGRRAA